jgi:hypothetical protein
MKKIENLFLIAGTGRNTGKTTMVCRVTRQFSRLGIISIKISPHFHEPSPGLIELSREDGFIIYEETDSHSEKDSSRMLQCGAIKVFYIQASEGHLAEGFNKLLEYIPAASPLVCESPALIRYVEPGVFVIMMPGDGRSVKDISEMIKAPHSEYTLAALSGAEELPFEFTDYKWKKTTA